MELVWTLGVGGGGCKSCNYDHINRQAFRTVSQCFIQFSSAQVTGLYSVTTYMKRFFPVFRYFNRAVLQLLQRTPSILDVSVGKPKQETISLILPLTARNCARLCDLLAVRPCPQIAQKTLSFLHSTEREKITKMMIIFKTPAILVCFLRHDPIKPQASVRRLAHTHNVTTCCSIRVCAAQRGRDFEASDLERSIHFRGVF